MEKIKSFDGTPIAVYKSGSGPKLLLVHGGGASDQKRWDIAGLRSALAEHFTVYTFDRRGRGESGDAAEYKLEREFEDAAAVADTIGEAVILLGHSTGAQIALEAALKTSTLYKLILYEPVFPIGDFEESYWEYSKQVTSNMQKMVDDGKNEQALILFLKELVNLNPAEIETYRSASDWQDRVRAVHTIPREEQATADYEFDAAKFKAITIPTLLLSGSESPPLFKEVTKTVNAALPDSRIVIFEGHGHVAMNTAPELFVKEVLAFARETN